MHILLLRTHQILIRENWWVCEKCVQNKNTSSITKKKVQELKSALKTNRPTESVYGIKITTPKTFSGFQISDWHAHRRVSHL
jgi:hypothetical protein